MYARCGSELERAYPARKKIRKAEAYKPKGEVATSREAVRGTHSTVKVADNKTAAEGRGSASFKSFKGGTSE